MILVVTTENETVRRATIASVPVFQIGAGGFVLNFNLKPGDLGWIKASDRDISLFLQSYNEAAPNTFRKHTFEDCVFFPNVMTGYTINSEDAENCVLQTIDGTQRVSIWPDKIKITSDTEIILDAPIIRTTGDLMVDGDVIGDAGGTTISLNSHVHSGVQSGGSNTGTPVA
jgi:copper chaperone CopZ